MELIRPNLYPSRTQSIGKYSILILRLSYGDIDEICSLFNDTFPSSQLTITSPLLDTVTAAKRESVLSGADGKGKIIKLNEFNDNTVIPLEPTDTRTNTECVFDRILRNPLGHSKIPPNSSFNNFTNEMYLKLAQSLGIDSAFILPVTEIHRISSSYYTSLKMQLINYFGVNVSLYSVKQDGNSLYHALSHIILGNQEYYNILKSKLMAKFAACHKHHFNLMRQSGILSGRNHRNILNQFLSEMHEVLTLSFACQELQQELILLLLTVLMQILSIEMSDRITYIASWKFPYSVMPSLSDRSCVCYTTGSITIWEMNTSTPSIFNSLTPVHNILYENLTLHNLFLNSPSTTIQSVQREM